MPKNKCIGTRKLDFIGQRYIFVVVDGGGGEGIFYARELFQNE